jgi:ribonuclease HI
MPTEAPKPDPLGALSVLLGSAEDVPEEPWTFAFDGGSRSNPGRAASAFCAWDPSGALVVEIAHYHYEDRSSNYAEWYALIMALEYIQQNKIVAAVIQGDSMLVIEQVCGRFAVLAPHLRDFARSAADILAATAGWIGIKHVRRALNKAADALVNEALDTHTDVRRINISKVQTKPEE